MLFLTLLIGLTLQVSCSIIVQYPPLVTGELGSSVNLSCHIGDMTGYCFSVVWFKLGQGDFPTLTPINAYLSGTHGPNAGLADKCNLTVTIKHSEPCTFFCAYVRGSAIYIGNGSTVGMKKRTVAVPTILVIAPDDNVPPEGDMVTLVCLVFGQVSDKMRISWFISGRVRTGTPGARSLNGASDVIRNEISIEERAWRDGVECTCVVETSDGQTFQRTVTNRHQADVTLTLLRSSEILLFLISVTVVMVTMHCLLQKGRRSTQTASMT